MMDDNPIQNIVGAMRDIQEDHTIPRGIRTRLAETVEILEGEAEATMRINKALDHLDDVTDDANLEPFTRTQLWNLVSMLESI